MLRRALLVAGTCCACATTTHAAITFTFDDPGSAREVVHVAGSGPTLGLLTYTSVPPVDLEVDGTSVGLGVLNYSTTLTMNINVGLATAVPGNPGAFVAPINGSFSFFDRVGLQDVLSASFSSGALFTFGAAGALISTNAPGGLAYSALGSLQSALAGVGIVGLIPAFDASFTLTDIQPGISVNQSGYLTGFTANAAYTGTANVPGPGAAGLLAAAGMALAARRRR